MLRTFGFLTIYVYIIGHYNPSFSQEYKLVSHTIDVVCVNFIRTTDFWEICSRQSYIFSEFFGRNLLRRDHRRNIFFFFHISFWCLAWNFNPDPTTNKPTHYILDNGDFKSYIRQAIAIWHPVIWLPK